MNLARFGTAMPWRLWASALCIVVASCGGGGGAGSSPPSGPGTGSGSTGDTGSPGLTLLAGHVGGPGNVNGTGSTARFEGMAGVALDAAGNAYVADKADQTIRRITPAGVVTTFAGISGVAGATDGALPVATFNQPMALAFDPSGNLIVVDAGNNTIRRISTQGIVSTLAGTAGTTGSKDGAGAAASFDFCRDTDLPPSDPGIVVDRAGNVYVLPCEPAIRRIAPDGTVSTLIKNDEVTPNAPVLLVDPQGLAIGPDETLYVSGSGAVRRVTLDGHVSIFGPVSGTRGGPGIAVDANGTVYRAEGALLYAIDPNGNEQVIAAMPWGGAVDGPVAQAQFNRITGLAIGPSGTIYVADAGNYSLRTLSNGTVATLAGEALFNTAADGQGAQAGFGFPIGIAIGGDGALYVADSDANAIRRVALDGKVSTIAGALGMSSTSSVDGTGVDARFAWPQALTSAPDGGLYAVDLLTGGVRHVSLSGNVTTVPFAYPTSGWVPWFDGIAVRQDGSLALPDQSGDFVMTMPGAGGAMTTLAGSGQSGGIDGDATSASFDAPTGIVADRSGNVYVSDESGCTLRKVDALGNVTTLAGSAGQCDFADGTGAQARFNSPRGMAIDPVTGSLYVADNQNQVIRKVTKEGVVTTVVGRPGVQGLVTGALPGVISWPQAVAIDGHTLYITSSRGVVVARDVP